MLVKVRDYRRRKFTIDTDMVMAVNEDEYIIHFINGKKLSTDKKSANKVIKCLEERTAIYE